MIKNAYKNGILGVEIPGDRGSYFYSNQIVNSERNKEKSEKKR